MKNLSSAVPQINGNGFFKSFFTGDLLAWFRNRFRAIDPFLIKVFCILFATANLVFIIHTTHYLFGNHDYSYVVEGVKPGATFWHGRYTNCLPIQLFGGHLVPVLNNLLSIAAMAISAMLCCGLFRLPRRFGYWLGASLPVMLFPYVMSWFFYAYETLSHMILPGLIAGAFLLVRDRFSLIRLGAASILIWFTLGVYPAAISTAGIFFCGLLLLDTLEGKFPDRQTVWAGVRAIIAILAGGCAFKLTILALKLTGKLSPAIYSLETPPASELPQKLIPTLFKGFEQFFHPHALVPCSLLMLMLVLVIGGILTTFIRPIQDRLPGITWKIFLVAAAWGGMFFASMLPDFLTAMADMTYVVRTGYFGLPFLTLTAFLLLLRFGAPILKNAGLIAAGLIIWCSAISDLEIQKNWKLGFEHEMLAYSRVLAMMEQSPEYHKLKSPINYLQMGSLPSERARFAPDAPDDGKESMELHDFTFNPDWSPRAGVPFSFLSSSVKWKNSLSFRENLEQIEALFDLNSHRFLEFLKTAKAYPAPSELCMFVDLDSNSVVLVLDESILETIRARCLDTNSAR